MGATSSRTQKAASGEHLPLLTGPCPGCRGTEVIRIAGFNPVPVHSVLLLSSVEEARSFPRGNLVLGFCRHCGLISNYRYDPRLQNYGNRCEESQGFSGTFAVFQREMAQRLVDQYGLRGKRILEIGCGKGDFLSLLCELGDNTGIGFDPAFIPERLRQPRQGRLTFIQDFFSEKYAGIEADFICCQMTLEHIHPVADFVSLLRAAVDSNRNAVVFVQVPDSARILKTCAFEDVYYEHCSYFTADSLQNVFVLGGFDVVEKQTEFSGQYITLTAKPAQGTIPVRCEPAESKEWAADFEERLHARMHRWRSFLYTAYRQNRKTVLWGSGSKAVAFLTGLGIGEEVRAVVDINPHRQGTYTAGTGHAIVSPEHLIEIRPDIVIAMNANYRREIRQALADQGLFPRLLQL